MAEVTKPIALDESLHTTESTPRNLADVLAEGLEDIANNVKPDASDIDLSPISGMSATNVQNGISELKQSLVETNKIIKYDSSGATVSTQGNTYTQLASQSVDAGYYLCIGYHQWDASTDERYQDYIGTSSYVVRNLSSKDGGGFLCSQIVKVTTTTTLIYATYRYSSSARDATGVRFNVIKLADI